MFQVRLVPAGSRGFAEPAEGEICFTPNARTIPKRPEKGAERRPGRVPSRDFNGIVNSIASGELWSIFAGVGRVTSFHPRPLTHGVHDGCRSHLLPPLIPRLLSFLRCRAGKLRRRVRPLSSNAVCLFFGPLSKHSGNQFREPFAQGENIETTTPQPSFRR